MVSKWLQDRSGNLSALAAVFLAGTTFMVGFAIDLASYERQKQRLQSAVDAASLAFGAVMRDIKLQEREDFSCPIEPVNQALAANGFGGDTVAASAERIDIDGKPGCRLTVSGSVETLMAESFGMIEGDVTVSATVVFEGQAPICLMSLSDDGTETFDLSTSPALDAKQCAAYVDSSDREAVELGEDDYDLRSICTVGPTDEDDPIVRPFCPKQPDPLTHLTYTGPTSCDFGRNDVADNWDEAPDGYIHVEPGVYCGGLEMPDSDLEYWFDPGVYVIKDGSLLIHNSEFIGGEGVTFVLMGDDAFLDIDTTSDFKFTAPVSGPYQGVVVMQSGHRADSLRSKIRGTAIAGFEGAVHLPDQKLDLDSSDLGNTDPANYVLYIADRVSILGRAPVHIPFQPGKSKVPMPASPYTAGIPRLVK